MRRPFIAQCGLLQGHNLLDLDLDRLAADPQRTAELQRLQADLREWMGARGRGPDGIPDGARRRGSMGSWSLLMREDQPHDLAMAEVRHNDPDRRASRAALRLRGWRDAIQNIVDLLAQEGIDGDCVLRLSPSDNRARSRCTYFAARWPNAAITWSFALGEDAKMEAKVGESWRTQKALVEVLVG